MQIFGLILLAVFAFVATSQRMEETPSSFIFDSKDLDQFRNPLYKIQLQDKLTGICEMAKQNKTNTDFNSKTPCSKITQNAHIIMSSMIELSFLAELREEYSPSRSLFEKEDKQISLTGCETGCTDSAMFACMSNCYDGIVVCEEQPLTPACLDALTKCGTVGLTSCCYCAAYYGCLTCDSCK